MTNSEQLRKRPALAALELLLDAIAPSGRIASVRRLRGGISCGMHALDLIERAGSRLRLVVRRYSEKRLEEQPDIATDEFRTLELLEKAGVPAPRPVWLDRSGTLFGAPAIVTSRIPGRPQLAPKHPESWLKQLAEALAALHAVDVTPEHSAHFRNQEATLPGTFRDPLKRAQWTRHIYGRQALAALESAWPEIHGRSIVHTDYWPGNTVWSRGKLAGIVDWESPRIGEPAYDVAYCRQDLVLLFGFETADRFRSLYESASGTQLREQPAWDLLVATRAMPDPAPWLPGYVDLGRTDVTAASMRDRHSEFVSRALAKLR